MTTTNQIIEDALAEIGAFAPGDFISADDYAMCLRKLNQLSQRWANMRLLLPVLTEIAVPLTGAQTYTIGPTGVIVASRPVKVVSAVCVDAGGLSQPVYVGTQEQWDDINAKNVTGGPVDLLWYQLTPTNGTLHVYPKGVSGYTLRLRCQTLLATFALGQTLALPEGYESALTLTLADDIGGAFGRPTPADLRRRASAATKTIKRSNLEPMHLQIDAALIGHDDYEIERGY